MNREIKFRIWDVVCKKFKYPNQKPKIFTLSLDGQVLDGEGCMYDELHIPQQYTGLKDKNGVEIYEGDIVKNWKCFGPAGEEEIISKVNLSSFGCNLEEWTYNAGLLPEVIGNIFENPELLK